MFVVMLVYALMIPDTLGWGLVELEMSFGLLRFAFIIVSIFGAILASNLFTLWSSENVVEAWMEFQEAKRARAAAIARAAIGTRAPLSPTHQPSGIPAAPSHLGEEGALPRADAAARPLPLHVDCDR